MSKKTLNPTSEPLFVRILLIATAVTFLALIVFLPLSIVFIEAFKKGFSFYFASLQNDYSLAAIKLTLLVSLIAVPLNMVFGVTASWAIAKYEFFGKRFLVTLIDLPFSVSPVISGLIYVLLFGYLCKKTNFSGQANNAVVRSLDPRVMVLF